MEEKLLAIKAIIVTALGVISTMLTWQSKLIIAMILMMVVDYITGTIAGTKKNGWSSQIAREGLAGKIAYFAVLFVAGCCDFSLSLLFTQINTGIEWKVICLPIVAGWYILTDAGSILENAVTLGAKVPGWLVKLLKITRDKLDSTIDTGDENDESV